MSEVIKDGLRLETEIEMLTLFGVSGFRCGGSWWITSPSGFKRIQPTSACADITKTIEVCIQDGNMGGINHIRISPYDGIILFLEAIIDVEMAQYAEAKNDTVIFEEVLFKKLGKVFKVVVKDGYAWAPCAIDSKGNIIHKK